MNDSEKSEWQWKADYCFKNKIPAHQSWGWQKAEEAYKYYEKNLKIPKAPKDLNL